MLCLFCGPALAATPAQSYLIRGIVRDSITGEGLPYVPVSVRDAGGSSSQRNILTDAKGIFEIIAGKNAVSLTARCTGYAEKTIPVSKNRVNIYEILLAPSASTLKEVVITRRRYSKKNNPAVDLMERIRALSKANDPEQHPFYNYDKYERISIAINDFHAGQGGTILKRFPFLEEHVDTSEVSGKPILNLAVKESSSQVHIRDYGKNRRDIITGLKSEGIDQITDQESMRAFLEDVLREVNLYDKDVNLLQNRFVSPLSPLAADFYKFYITDTVLIDSVKYVELSFYPHNKSAFGFVGSMYVEPSDTAMFIRRVHMRVPSEINLNFIENMFIEQEFTRATDGSRLKVKDDLVLEVKVLPGTPGLYVRRNSAFTGHNFDPPEGADTIFSTIAATSVLKGAATRDSVFWNEVRLIPLLPNEARVSTLMQRLRKVPLYYWTEKGVKLLASGYVATGHDSKFDIGPLNTFVSANTLEGLRLRLGGMTTANLSPHFFSRFYVAHGFRDHKWKYGIELEYSFNKKKYHSREFPRHSIMLKSSYDVDQLGQHYLFTNQDNVFLSLKRMSDHNVSYLLDNSVSYILELENHFSVSAQIANQRQFKSRLLKFMLRDNALKSLIETDHFNQTWAEISLRFAPNEKFYQTRSHRFPINMDSPIITLTHRYGPGQKSWSRWNINRTELSIQKRFWFSAWGYLDILCAGGHVWSKNTPYTQLFIPNANLSYTIQPESFSLMNPMEFVTDSYATWFVTYWANGAIFNYIPYLKKLKLREVFSFSGYAGNLSMRNNPDFLTSGYSLDLPEGNINAVSIRHTPYMEASVGIDNLFRCLRVDYVWRLTHRYPGYKIDRSGLRVAFHVTF